MSTCYHRIGRRRFANGQHLKHHIFLSPIPMTPMRLTAAVVATIASLPVAVESTNGFLYNNDAECTLPFTQSSIDFTCQGNYRQNGNTEYQQEAENGCYFGDSLMAYGSFVLTQQVNRYFSLTTEVCYYGGSGNAFYKPKRCSSYRRSIDMRSYALMIEEGEESDYTEGWGELQSYWQDEARQEWEEQRAQARAYQAEVEQTYLEVGTYSFNLGLTIPQKKFPFENGSELRVTVTLIPRDSYTLPYYRYRTRYRSGISDSKYQTSCFLSFDAIPVYSASSRYSYYRMAGLGIVLLGAATYVSSKRRVVCLCDRGNDTDDDVVLDSDYQSHIEIPISMPTSKKKTNYNIAGEASILTF